MLVKIMTEHVINPRQSDKRKGSEKHISLRLALLKEPLIRFIFIIIQPKSH